MKKLIVYYTRTGITAEVARLLNKELGGELEEIKDTRNRKGVLAYLQSAMEAALKKQAKILKTKNDPGEYDLVVVGTPVWSHNMSTPVRAYLEENKTSFKNTVFFATCGSTGASKTLRDMENICGKKARPLLEIKKTDMKSGKYQEKVKQFVRDLQT
ncbi:MAG: flavodoxin [Bacillota bacterium]|nr:flavodoxin [Bacillota bacterium]